MRLMSHIYALALAGLATPGSADGLSFEYGLICQVTAQGERSAPNTELGHINLINQDRRFDITTTQIPAQLGLSFGIRALFDGTTVPDKIDISVTHPPMGQAGITEQHWDAVISPDRPVLNVFSFEFPYEMVPGIWEFRLLHDGTELARQRFEVLETSTTAEVERMCFGASLMS
jgi:hypothetical protein